MAGKKKGSRTQQERSPARPGRTEETKRLREHMEPLTEEKDEEMRKNEENEAEMPIIRNENQQHQGQPDKEHTAIIYDYIGEGKKQPTQASDNIPKGTMMKAKPFNKNQIFTTEDGKGEHAYDLAKRGTVYLRHLQQTRQPNLEPTWEPPVTMWMELLGKL